MLIAPEIILLAGSTILFFVSLARDNSRIAQAAAMLTTFALMAASVVCLGQHGELFFKSYRIDLFSQIFKLLISFGLLAVMLFGARLKGISDDVRAEYYLFLFLATLGLMMVVSSVELLTLFVSLELSSFALYLLVPLRDDSGGIRAQMEASAKYLLFGVMVTGIMLFGMSYLFGLTGSTYLADIMARLSGIGAEPAVIVAVAMVLCAFCFKLGMFPFHFWLPDVYQGASNETAAYIAAVPKVAAIALVLRAAALFSPDAASVGKIIGVLAVCSMFYGNILALVQKDIKRMLGFSGIAHAGYVMLGVIILKESGYAAAVYYITGYLVMNLACFLVICAVSREGENPAIEDFSGLYQRSPLLALTLACAMFALAGIPPFVGFMGKFFLLAGALENGFLFLVILAAVNTAISIYYYLSVVRVAYTADPGDREPVRAGFVPQAIGLVLIMVIIVMGVLPGRFLEIAGEAVKLVSGA